MNHRIHRSDEEWMQLITSCRQSGLSDREWCASNNIVVSSFVNVKSLARGEDYGLLCSTCPASGKHRSGRQII